MHGRWPNGLTRGFAGGILSCVTTLMTIPALPALAQSGLAGWSMEVMDRSGLRQRCRLQLSEAESIVGGRRASVSGCGGTFISVSQWREGRRGLVLADMSGSPVVTLHRSPGGYFGRANGQSVRIHFGSSMPVYGNSFGPSFDPPTVSIPIPRGCSIYYGQSQRCAGANDINVPRLVPGQSVSVRVVAPANLREAPSAGASILRVVPVNVCLQADSCGPQADGTAWCRVRHGSETGYVTKLTQRDGRRYILFSNACS